MKEYETKRLPVLAARPPEFRASRRQARQSRPQCGVRVAITPCRNRFSDSLDIALQMMSRAPDSERNGIRRGYEGSIAKHAGDIFQWGRYWHL